VRVALLTYSTRPRGGVVHTLALAEALAGLGATVTVHAVGRGGDAAFFRPVDPRVEVRLAPLPEVDDETVGERVLRSIAALAGIVDPAAHDVVHAQDCISANAVPGAIRTVHHLDRFTTPELARCHERALVTPSAHVCVSAAVAAELRQGWGIGATVIPNGVDAGRFAAAAADDDPAAVAARRRWRDRLGPGPIVLAVGGIEPRKGTVHLPGAVRRLAGRGLPARLVIAGGETLFDYRDYRVAFDRACAEHRIRPVVLGPVADAELPALVAAADVFAFPSVQEGFGLAAMEALAAGVPTVVADLPVLREVFAGAVRFAPAPLGADGLAAALAAALDDRARGRDHGRRAAGRALAAAHRWDTAARAHLDLYERHLQRRRPESTDGAVRTRSRRRTSAAW
jgi:glycosyltransferase-like protein